MLINDVRRRLVEKVEQVGTDGDEEATGLILAYVRAVLVTIAGRPEEEEVVLEDLALGTGKAALILGLHPEYVRSLVRRGSLPATKKNGEFRIALSDVVDYMVTGIKTLSGHSLYSAQIREMLDSASQIREMLEDRKGNLVLWGPPDEQGKGEKTA